ADLPYEWHQTLADVDISIPLPAGTRARDLQVVIQKSRIRIAPKASSTSSSSSSPLLEGDLFAAVQVDDSTWTIEDQCLLLVHLEKQNRMQWWPHVVTHHPQIDVTKIQPENSKLSDLDGETRGMVEKMMYEQQQKARGETAGAGADGEEARKRQMLEQFKQQHPEMDFSQAKV
ncbi:HSP20-like chaperone, partial [Dimargaris cristalligena]